jgi:hypothetical protein
MRVLAPCSPMGFPSNTTCSSACTQHVMGGVIQRDAPDNGWYGNNETSTMSTTACTTLLWYHTQYTRYKKVQINTTTTNRHTAAPVKFPLLPPYTDRHTAYTASQTAIACTAATSFSRTPAQMVRQATESMELLATFSVFSTLFSCKASPRAMPVEVVMHDN